MVNENTNNLIRILKGSAFAIIITLCLLMVYSAILTYTNVNENGIPIFVITATAASVLIGSLLATSKIQKNGIINGVLVGGIYVFSLYIISSIITKNFSLNNYSIIMMATCLLIGGIGGIVGVNRK